MNVDAVLERLKTAYQVRDLEAVALRLEMDELTFRVWRTRKSVPSKVLVKASQDTGRSVTWLSDGYLGDEDLVLRDPQPVFFAPKEKQVNLTQEEKTLLDNFRMASPEGRIVITAASTALAKANLKGKKTS